MLDNIIILRYIYVKENIMEQLNYETELEKIFNKIGKSKFAVLATSSHNKPTVRTMSIVFFDNKIYFQTSNEYVKYKQISENNNVALCIGNIQIEGLANIKGITMEHSNFIKNYKKYHNSSYKKYSKLDCSRLIEVIPIKIIIWEYNILNGKPSRLFLELETKKAYREMEPYTE
jgi:general stress protein 26